MYIVVLLENFLISLSTGIRWFCIYYVHIGEMTPLGRARGLLFFHEVSVSQILTGTLFQNCKLNSVISVLTSLKENGIGKLMKFNNRVARLCERDSRAIEVLFLTKMAYDVRSAR